MRLFISLLLFAALLISVTPGSASAHAEIVSSTPKAGSTVDAAPATITASFSQKLGPDESSLTVLDEQGARVDNNDSALNPADADGKTMSVSLKASLAAGTYTVEWKTLSAEDGEAEQGQFQFTIAAGATASASASAAPVASASPAASASARPSASASAGPAATQSAGAAPAASAAGGAQPGALPTTSATGQPIGFVTLLAALLLGLGLLLRRSLKQ